MMAAMGRSLPHAAQQGAWRLSSRNRTSASRRGLLRMLAERPCRVRLRCLVCLAITFPDFTQAVIDQALSMPAAMGLGFDAGREVGCVDHAGQNSPATGSWRGLFVVRLGRNGFAAKPSEQPEFQTSFKFV